MKAVVLKKNESEAFLEVTDLPKPEPKAGEMLVRVRASSLNFHDLALVNGMLPVEEGRIPLSDGAGEVVAVGENTSLFKEGDKVLSTFYPAWKNGEVTEESCEGIVGDHVDGFAAEYVAMPEHYFTRMPDGYSFTEAATLPCAALTAWRGMFVENSLKPGDWVLTQGSGGVSLFALQMAKAAGANVISTSSSDEKLKRMRALGADHTINYKNTPEWGLEACKLTNGRGVDEVVEIGGAGTMAQSLAAMRYGGHISLIGFLGGFVGDVPIHEISMRNITVSGITVGSKSHQEDLVSGIEASGIKPVLDKDFALEDLADAFAYQTSQQHFGKITINI